MLLLVEAENTPAVTLYKRMGFREIFRDNEAKASKVLPDTRMLYTPKILNLLMCTAILLASTRLLIQRAVSSPRSNHEQMNTCVVWTSDVHVYLRRLRTGGVPI